MYDQDNMVYTIKTTVGLSTRNIQPKHVILDECNIESGELVR